MTDYTNFDSSVGTSDKVGTGVGKDLSTRVGRLRDRASISAVFRLAGALALAAGMGLYLLEGLHVTGDAQRFLTMLGYTACLAACGFAMSHLLRDMRGARVFFSITVLSTPANFTVLGALILSVIAGDSHVDPHVDSLGDLALDAFPSYAHWTLADNGNLWIIAAAAAAVVVPVTWFGFSVLARTARHTYTLALLGTSSLLLIPVRDDITTATIALVMISGLGWLLIKTHRQDVSLRTFEGRLAQLLLAAPLAILLGRSILLYEADSAMGLALSLAILIVARSQAPGRDDASFRANLLHGTQALSGLAAIVFLFQLLPSWSDIGSTLLVNALMAILFIDLWRRTGHTRLRSVLSQGGVLLYCLNSLLLLLLDSSSIVPALVTSASLLTVIVFTLCNRLGTECTMGVGALAVVILMHFDDLAALVMGAGWWGVAVVGVLAIVAATLIERHGMRVRRLFEPCNRIDTSGDVSSRA